MLLRMSKCVLSKLTPRMLISGFPLWFTVEYGEKKYNKSKIFIHRDAFIQHRVQRQEDVYFALENVKTLIETQSETFKIMITKELELLFTLRKRISVWYVKTKLFRCLHFVDKRPLTLDEYRELKVLQKMHDTIKHHIDHAKELYEQVPNRKVVSVPISWDDTEYFLIVNKLDDQIRTQFLLNNYLETLREIAYGIVYDKNVKAELIAAARKNLPKN